MFKKELKTLKTLGHIAKDVMAGKALVETLIPNKRNHVTLEKVNADGSRQLLAEGWNSRVNAGASWEAKLLGSCSSGAAIFSLGAANNMALSTTVLTPAMGDTTLSGEVLSSTNSGLARVGAAQTLTTTPGTLGGSAAFTMSNTFTSSGTATVNSAALFTSATVGSGSLFVEANLSPAATLASGDQLVLTWVVNY